MYGKEYKQKTAAVEAVNGTTGQVERQYHYYPYGALFGECAATALQGAGADSRQCFEGKEQVSCGDMSFLDYPARPYDPLLLQFWTDDPLCEKYPSFGPRLYCMGDPINTSDPTGCDTVKINFLNNKWTITETILSKDNDVFIVTKDGSSKTYSFTEGEYGNRVLALTLYDDGEGSYNLGVYHVSWVQENGTGFYVTPGGLPSSKDGSGKRIPDGYYPLTTPIETNEWRTPGVGGAAGLRGVRFHYGGSNPLSWTKGCFILSYDYEIVNGTVLYNKHQKQLL